MNLKYKWTEQEIDFLKQNYVSQSVASIARMMEKSEVEVKAVVVRLKKQGLLGRKKWRNKTEKCLQVLASATREEIVYLAGLIDGEGTISIARSQKGYHRPIVNITTTDLLLIEWLGRFFWQKPNRRQIRKLPYYKAVLTGFGIVPFLEAIEPFLVIKKLQCRLLKKFIELRGQQKWKTGPTNEMLEIMNDIRALNAPRTISATAKAEVRQKYLSR